jgi:aminocarboxymuconate-semialdehyde decarboxylase
MGWAAARTETGNRSGGMSKGPVRRTRKAPGRVRRRGSDPVIDFHTHIMVQEVTDYVLRERPADNPECRLVHGFMRGMNGYRLRHPRATQDAVEARLADMDECGIDVQVVSGHVAQYVHWADAETAAAMHRTGNDRLAEFVARKPDRLIGMGMLPMQDPAAAVAELERMVGSLGLRAVQMCTNVDGVELGDERLWPFWARAEALAVPVFVHAAGFNHPRFRKHLMWNGLGQPIEEALAMASLIYEGVLERFPRLKLSIAHGGGFLPYYAGRVDRNFRNRPEETPQARQEPSAYMRRFFYDTAVYNPDMLEFLVQKVGASQVFLGGDYPVGEDDPVGFVKRARGLSAATRRMILGGNAARFLGLAP